MTKKPSESEDEYFARQDAEARRKLAVEKRREMEAAEAKALRDLHYMHCPSCGHKLENVSFKGLQLAGKEPGFLHSVVSLFKGDK